MTAPSGREPLCGGKAKDSLLEGGGAALAVTEGVVETGSAGIDEKGADAGIFWVTPSVTFGDSSLWEGAFMWW